MTDIEQFNLFWLCNAMTAPSNSEGSYYYDGVNRRLFCSKGDNELFNMIDLSLPEAEAVDLLVRLELIESESSEIVEIPRLNVSDKVAVQLLFLSNFPGIVHAEDLRLDVEEQLDVAGFVLDVVLAKNDVLGPMVPYWDNFKLKTIQFYLEKFTGLVGITSRLI